MHAQGGHTSTSVALPLGLSVPFSFVRSVFNGECWNSRPSNINYIDFFYGFIHAVTVKPQWLEHDWLVYYGRFELVFESLGNSFDS